MWSLWNNKLFLTQAMQFVQLLGNASQKLNKKLCCHQEQCVALYQALMEPFPIISSLGTVYYQF